MTDAAVMESVVNKAHANGYKFSWDSINHMNLDVLVPQVIFDFSFAKALWGEKRIHASEAIHGCTELCLPSYQYHLKQLAIAPNRIEYLKQFVE